MAMVCDIDAFCKRFEQNLQNLVAQFLAVYRRSKMVAMGTRKPRRGSRLCRRWALKWSEEGQLRGQYCALQRLIN